ncbi:MAG TPA: cytochrome c3 family protein [Anaeromyxobacteraceae bacterium]|nr:cytochrome c3 family protein [Anaeromyxobacteraceae bacterium]
MIAPAAALLLACAALAPGRQSRLDASKHNFFGAGNRSPGPGMDLCQFCHVPNQLPSAAAATPLWAPGAAPQAAALDVRAEPTGQPQPLRFAGSTLRCLSCHDATVSRKNIAFRPSSTSLRGDGVAADRHRTEADSAVYLAIPDGWSGKVMGNHPVGVPYPLGSAGYRLYNPRATPLGTDDWQPDPRLNGLKLFTDQSGFDVPPGGAGIECASCHDPHGTPNLPFLRLPKAGSVLCLGCHRK